MKKASCLAMWERQQSAHLLQQLTAYLGKAHCTKREAAATSTPESCLHNGHEEQLAAHFSMHWVQNRWPQLATFANLCNLPTLGMEAPKQVQLWLPTFVTLSPGKVPAKQRQA